MRLTDWIVNAVEAHIKQQIAGITIPQDLSFPDLRLARDPDGSVSFSWAAIERICKANQLSVEIFQDTPEDNVASLIVGWYRSHRENGGEPDPVAEDLIAEVLTEERAGQTISHEPGRA